MYYHDPLKGINVEEEYSLIMQKKSRLSASMREKVKLRYLYNKAKAEKEALEAKKEEPIVQ